ncbi:unnamed protein product [Triticum turgidum subsp. durum]|uniref:Uncharacterized protein n=1 Tax=Triticum turgidum subsp. durum TaxID=4567 RepID=A0A9R0REP7_TRITD|nr:unnamed protein product [Triticum turgidum subsp. durum]
MGVAEIAKKVDALKAELAAKSSRIADLEARVSLLEAENARLRKAMSEGVAMNRRAKKGPTFGRLEEGLGGNKQKSADIAGGHLMNDVIEVSDGEEEGMAVDVNSGEEGVPPVPTPSKCAVRVVTGKRGVAEEIKDADGGGGRDHGSVRCDGNVILDDDDVLITPRGKKRTATRVISDSESEDEDENGQGHGDGEVGVRSSRKCLLRGVSDSASEDGSEGVRVVNQKPVSPLVTTGVESEDDDGELHEMEGRSTPATRRFARLAEGQSKRMRPTRRKLEFFEPKNHEESEDDSEEDDNMENFIVDDSDCSENSADSVEESSAGPEESDDEETYKELMDRIRGKRNAKNKDWKIEPEMLSAFDEYPELRLKAVCALYRKQTQEEQAGKAIIMHNKKGFNQIDARRNLGHMGVGLTVNMSSSVFRGSNIAQFLLDGDAAGPLKKTAQDLENYDRKSISILEMLPKELFCIVQLLFSWSQNVTISLLRVRFNNEWKRQNPLRSLDVFYGAHNWSLKMPCKRQLLKALIDAYASRGEGVEDGRVLFDALGSGRTAASWKLVIAGYNNDSALRLGKQVHGTFLQRTYDKGLQTSNTLVNMYSNSGRITDVKPKKYVYVCVIDLLARAGTLRHTFDPIDKMQFAPDESFWGALVACKMHRNVELGRLVARKIIEVNPDGAKNHVLLDMLQVANGVSMVSRGGY